MRDWVQAAQLAVLGACTLGALALGHAEIAATLAGGMLGLALPQRRENNGGADGQSKTTPR